MSDTDFSYLKIWRDEADQIPPGFTRSPLVEGIRSRFEEATGWVLDRVEPLGQLLERVRDGLSDLDATAPLQIVDLSAGLEANQRAAHRQKCDALAEAISTLLRELAQTRKQLRDAHHELASCGWASVRCEQLARWGDGISKLLASATNANGFESSALFLLDDHAQKLIKRFSSGTAFDTDLHRQRLMSASPADVEAMAGHALVLTRVAEMQKWCVPAAARTAVCLPVSTLSNVLGTVWFVTGRRRKVSNHLLNMLELSVGRLAAEIESEGLMRHLAQLRSQSVS